MPAPPTGITTPKFRVLYYMVLKSLTAQK